MSAEGVTRAAALPFEEPTTRYSEPRLLRSAEQVELSITLPGLDDGAYARVWHKGLNTARAFARKITVPPGGGTPIHGVTCDHVIVQQEGTVEFVMDLRVFRLEPGDLFYFPANMLYELRNPGTTGASLISIGIEAEFGWPARSSYWREPGADE
jgi:mannose-6-phosphate isomerase-like protein (cupin superfamily)